METTQNLKPLPLWQAIIWFGIPAIVTGASIYFLMPYLMERGLTEDASESIAFLIPAIFMLALALVAYRLEGSPMTWAGLKSRFRIRRMTGKDWLWTGALLVWWGIYGLVLAPILLKPIFEGINNGIIPIPDFVPASVDPRQASSAMDAEVGWWSVITFLLVATIGVIGEEFLWRGYILPRQELTHGKWTWVIHGVLWALFHAFKYWAVPVMMLGTLALSFVSQRQKSTMPALIVHYAEKIFSAIVMALMVMGIA